MLKSIKSKICFVVLSGIIVSSFIVGSFGIFWSNNAIRRDSAELLDLMAQTQTTGLNTMFDSIEKSSIILSHYVAEDLNDLGIFREEEKFARYMGHISDISYYIANCTSPALSVFVRFAPELTTEVESILWKRVNGVFVQDTLTEFPVYDSDFDNSWYYKARMKGQGVWTKPYYDDDLKEYVVSYSLPVYKDGRFVAVIGMNIDFDDIVEIIKSISVYDSGHAFLTDEDFVITYHRRLPAGTRIFANASEFKIFQIDGLNTEIYEYKNSVQNSKNKSQTTNFRMIYKDLQNGMKLVVSVPDFEIDRTRNHLIFAIFASVLVITILVSISSILVSNRFTRPLKELIESTKNIIVGDYDLNFSHKPKDEIGELMTTFTLMAKSLKIQFDYINSLVYYDSMTGAKNKRAFIDVKSEIDKKIADSREKNQQYEFGIVVFDVNDLKYMNDNFGHEAGDKLIKSACNLIRNNFTNSQIFRIGGDEFVVILENKDYENRTELLTKLRTDMDLPLPVTERNEAFDKISMAAGLAVYDSQSDKNFQSVFEKADTEMYNVKVAMKGGKENVR